ncbi:hypothetical protein FOVSG1_006725 [Fusarium oxysporum f. sp. vasinfectum]
MTSTTSVKNQCTAKSSGADEHEKKAFRRRQAEYLRELRSRAEASQRPDSERIVTLEQENSLLRRQLTDVQSRLEGLQVTLQMITDSISQRPQISSPTIEESPEMEETSEQFRGSTTIIHQAQPAANTQSFLSASVSHFDQNSLFSADDALSSTLTTDSAFEFPNGSLLGFAGEPAINHDPLDMQWMRSPLQTQRMPDIWTFRYQMGTQSYANTIAVGQRSTSISGLEWTQSNSPFSDHIQVLRQLLRGKLNQPMLTKNDSCRSLYLSVSAVLAMFNSITRPDVMNWLQSQYPCVIDWIPFSSVRNGLIQLHAANPCIDQIFCDAVSAYVVEASLSELVIGAQPTKVYIRVTDLIATMSLDEEGQETGLIPTLPVPDVKTLFSSPKYACLVFKHLKMDCGASYYKIDPVFFSKYPELCDSGDDIIASGIPLRPDTQTTLTYPNHLDAFTVATYRSFINFSLDAATQICKVSLY